MWGGRGTGKGTVLGITTRSHQKSALGKGKEARTRKSVARGCGEAELRQLQGQYQEREGQAPSEFSPRGSGLWLRQKGRSGIVSEESVGGRPAAFCTVKTRFVVPRKS